MKIRVTHGSDRDRFLEDASAVLKGWEAHGKPADPGATRLAELHDIFLNAKDGEEVTLSEGDMQILSATKAASDLANGSFPLEWPSPPPDMGRAFRDVLLQVAEGEAIASWRKDVLLYMADQVVQDVMILRNKHDATILMLIMEALKGE